MKIIYHASCTDGFTAAWVAWLKYGDSAEYIAANYGDEPPEALGEDVLILDFSYPRRHLEYMAGVAESIRVIDHHKTAEAELAGLSFCTFDMGRSGAGLAWDVLMPDAPRPALVGYVEDRDLWRWALPNSREVSAWLSSWKPEFKKWSELSTQLEIEPGYPVGEGAAILRALNGYVAGMAGKYSWATIGGHGVPIINTTHAISELVGELSLLAKETGDAKFAAGWFQKQDGKFVYSLRSRGDFDVSEVAKQYGGGGHKNAAGFTLDTLIPVESP